MRTERNKTFVGSRKCRMRAERGLSEFASDVAVGQRAQKGRGGRERFKEYSLDSEATI